MIQIKEFSEYSGNNEALTNKWLSENSDKYTIISVNTHYNTIVGSIAYVIIYKSKR
jgi:hypothetical protein